MLTSATLIDDLPPAPEARPVLPATPRAANSQRPAPAVKRRPAIGLRAKLLKKLGQAQAWLELDHIHRHGNAPLV